MAKISSRGLLASGWGQKEARGGEGPAQREGASPAVAHSAVLWCPGCSARRRALLAKAVFLAHWMGGGGAWPALEVAAQQADVT